MKRENKGEQERFSGLHVRFSLNKEGVMEKNTIVNGEGKDVSLIKGSKA